MATRPLEAKPGLTLGIWGARRPRWLVAIGVTLMALAATALCFSTPLRRPAHAFGMAVVPIAGCLGLSVLVAGISDAAARRRLRRTWRRRRIAAWHADPVAPLEGYHQSTALRPAGFGWGRIMQVLAVTVIAAWLANRLLGFSGIASKLSLGALVVSCVIMQWNKRASGRVTAGVLFSEPRLAPGRTGDVIFQVDATRVDLPIESFEFTLRCTRSYADAVAGLAPISIRLIPGLRPKWTLRFVIPADAPASDLLADPPVRWELVVSAAGPTAVYEDRLAVPVLGPADRSAATTR